MSKSAIELEIVNLVRQKRKEKKLSQAKVAQILNVTAGYIGQIEMKSSLSMYSYCQLNELARFFDCSPKDFLPDRAINKKEQ